MHWRNTQKLQKRPYKIYIRDSVHEKLTYAHPLKTPLKYEVCARFAKAIRTINNTICIYIMMGLLTGTYLILF